MNMKTRVLAYLIAGGFVLSALSPALAGSEGRKNTAIGLTAGSIYALTQDKDTIGLVGAAGSAYAWHQYNKARKDEVSKRAYNQGYRAASSGSSRTYSTSRSVRSVRPATSVNKTYAAKPAPKPVQVTQAHRELLPQPVADGYMPGYVMVPAGAAMVAGATAPMAYVQPVSYSDYRTDASDTDSSNALPWIAGLSAFALGVGGTLAATRSRRSDTIVLGARRR